MDIFKPDLVFFEPQALEYPMGQNIFKKMEQMGVEIRQTTSHNRVTGIPGETELEKYKIAKRTLVVGVRKSLEFDGSMPSAEYAIPISTGCFGHCHYCYLQTNLGSKPYVRVYVNVDEIIESARRYIEEREPNITRFEAAGTSDPISLEPITGTLRRLIEFMGTQPNGRLRFVTKYNTVDTLLDAKHNGHTRFRFSVNASYVIKNFEPATSSFEERIEAAGKVARAGYPLGLIVAPIILFEGWEAGYTELFEKLAVTLPDEAKETLTFELIQHRFTKTSKRIIETRYPKSKLVMDETSRKYKWGKYGRGKYVYLDEQQWAIQRLMTHVVDTHFPKAKIEYFT